MMKKIIAGGIYLATILGFLGWYKATIGSVYETAGRVAADSIPIGVYDGLVLIEVKPGKEYGIAYDFSAYKDKKIVRVAVSDDKIYEKYLSEHPEQGEDESIAVITKTAKVVQLNGGEYMLCACS